MNTTTDYRKDKEPKFDPRKQIIQGTGEGGFKDGYGKFYKLKDRMKMIRASIKRLKHDNH